MGTERTRESFLSEAARQPLSRRSQQETTLCNVAVAAKPFLPSAEHLPRERYFKVLMWTSSATLFARSKVSLSGGGGGGFYLGASPPYSNGEKLSGAPERNEFSPSRRQINEIILVEKSCVCGLWLISDARCADENNSASIETRERDARARARTTI